MDTEIDYYSDVDVYDDEAALYKTKVTCKKRFIAKDLRLLI